MSLPWASRACGIFIAIQDSLEGAMTADLVPETSQWGLAYGTNGAVNGVGDFISSTVADVVWSLYSPVAAFVYAAVMMAAGAVITGRAKADSSLRRARRSTTPAHAKAARDGGPGLRAE
jgi:MFS family permease